MTTGLLLSAAATGAVGQEQPKTEIRREVIIERRGAQTIVSNGGGTVVGATDAMPATFTFLSAAGMEGGPVVRSAPYTAETVTETTRTLADGTRIQSKNTASLARDKEGRTRRENSFSHIGPWANNNQQAPRFVTITDPVAKETYILNLNDRTATKTGLAEPMIFHHQSKSAEGGTKTVTEERVEMSVSASLVGGITPPAGATQSPNVTVAVPFPGAGVTATRAAFHAGDVTSEALGRQTMEGVQVEGTRTTHTIPAGAIGNDRPLVTVTEKWYSPELQMTIYTKTNDPQMGESIYRVTNLRRDDPDASLFRVPADFKVVERPGGAAARSIWVEQKKE